MIQVKNEDGEIVREYKKIEERFINGELLEITDTTIKVQKNDVYEMEGGGTLVWNTEEEVTILIGETTFEIWRTNTRGTIDPIISIAKVDDLHIGDGIDVHGDYEGERFVAEKIVIWRFDVK
ncbi:MAG: hypothetical protein LBI53_00580 [Candidatus Peribacteria bacterium]|nr:hypothetical protein [Candidatus Peribacteria bacterium]